MNVQAEVKAYRGESMKKAIVTVALALGLSACGAAPELTNADVDRMGQDKALALLECQMGKVVEDKGMEAGQKHVEEAYIAAIEEDGDTVQVKLWEEGYTCEEDSYTP
jgi:predicted nucleotidyltransferase